MDDGVLNLRKRTISGSWTVPIVLAVLGVLALVGSLDEDASGPGRIAAAVVALLCALGVVGCLLARRRTMLLVIDHEGIRLETGRRKPAFRLTWPELSGVGLLVSVQTHRHRGLLRFFTEPTVDVGLALELHPAGEDAVRRHPELRLPWRMGRERCWRIGLGTAEGEVPPIAAMVARHRPDLWRGERAGTVFSP